MSIQIMAFLIFDKTLKISYVLAISLSIPSNNGENLPQQEAPII